MRRSLRLTACLMGLLAVPALILAAPPFFEAWPSHNDDGGGGIDQTAPTQGITPEPMFDIWFSTEIGFTSASDPTALRHVSDGDLISMRRCVLFTNYELTRYLGIMPLVPDLGLDAVTLPYYWPIPEPVEDAAGQLVSPMPPAAEIAPIRWPVLFSLEETVFSETMGWIGHGDLLSSAGAIVRTNWQLVRSFDPYPVCLCPDDGSYCECRDYGLDAVDEGVMSNYCVGFLFSTERDFYSAHLGQTVSHGDLLSELGYIYRTNAQLMSRFHPYDPPSGVSITDHDYGLDAVYVSRRGEVWFSVEEGFYDREFGWVSDGDLLSEAGRVVYRNLDLVRVCSPLEDCANFGLDAVERWPGWLLQQAEPEPIDEPN